MPFPTFVMWSERKSFRISVCLIWEQKHKTVWFAKYKVFLKWFPFNKRLQCNPWVILVTNSKAITWSCRWLIVSHPTTTFCTDKMLLASEWSLTISIANDQKSYIYEFHQFRYSQLELAMPRTQGHLILILLVFH